jgi:hypothetical protein
MDTLLEIILENDEVTSDNACETLLLFFSTISENVLLNSFLWYDACEYIYKMLQSGNNTTKENAKIIMYHLEIKFNIDYPFFLSFFENDDQRKFVNECMNGYQNDKIFTNLEIFLKQNS